MKVKEAKVLEKNANQLDQKYRCQECGTEAIYVKVGEGQASCCGQEMQIQKAQQAKEATTPAKKEKGKRQTLCHAR
jgi:transcription elongation factor Elf1